MSRYANQDELDEELQKIKSLDDETLIHHVKESYSYYKRFRMEMQYEKADSQGEYNNLVTAELRQRLSQQRDTDSKQSPRHSDNASKENGELHE